MACCFGDIDKASWVHFLPQWEQQKLWQDTGKVLFPVKDNSYVKSIELSIGMWGISSASGSV